MSDEWVPPTDAEWTFRLQVVAWLQDHLDEMVADMLTQIEKQVPEYAAISDQALLADIHKGVKRVALISLSVLSESRPLSREEAGAIKVIGARRSQQNLALDPFISAVRTGLKVGSDWTMEIATKLSASGAEAQMILAGISRDLFNLQVDVITSASSGYAENQGSRAKRSVSTESLRDLLAEPQFKQELAHQATALGCDLASVQRLILLADDKGNLQSIQKASEAFLRAVPTAVEVTMADAYNPHIALIVSDATWEKASRITHDLVRSHPVAALLTRAVTSPRQFHQEYQESQDMVGLAVKLRGLHCAIEANDLLVHWYLENPLERKERFLEKTIGAVLQQPNASLLMKVLEAWISGELHTAAARRLEIAERSFRRHRKQLKELTGLNMQIPDQHFRLHLALRVWQLSQTGQQLAGIGY